MTTEAPLASPPTVYTGRTTNGPMMAATIAGALLIVVLSSTGDGGWNGLAIPLALIAVGIVADLLTATSVRASAGPNGFDVRWGLLGWPRCTYRIDQIARVEIIDLPWYRVSFGFWWTPRRTSCTIRSGPNVRLVLTSGRIVTVTVPDPHLAVRALQDAGVGTGSS